MINDDTNYFDSKDASEIITASQMLQGNWKGESVSDFL